MSSRYTRRVKTDKEEFDADGFLKQHGFREDQQGFGVYRKGLGFFGPPSFISVDVAGGKATITAWKKHALLPGVFAFDVNRRGRKIERLADQLASYMNIEKEQDDAQYGPCNKLSVVSLIFGIVSLAAWLVPVIGFSVSFIGLFTSIFGGSKSKNRVASLGQCLSVFGLTAAFAKVILGFVLAL